MHRTHLNIRPLHPASIHYRHFASQQALLQVVRAAALSEGAKAMEDKVATVRAVGTGCLRLAKADMGLFLTAFVPSHQLIQATPKWPGAEILAWSAVHGLIILVVFGQKRAAALVKTA